MNLSIVTTLYNSAPCIEEVLRRVLAEIKKLPVDYEIIFVDDGSPDNGITMSSNRPLIFIGYSGALIAILASVKNSLYRGSAS